MLLCRASMRAAANVKVIFHNCFSFLLCSFLRLLITWRTAKHKAVSDRFYERLTVITLWIHDLADSLIIADA